MYVEECHFDFYFEITNKWFSDFNSVIQLIDTHDDTILAASSTDLLWNVPSFICSAQNPMQTEWTLFYWTHKSFLVKMPVKTIFGQNNDPIHKWMEEE